MGFFHCLIVEITGLQQRMKYQMTFLVSLLPNFEITNTDGHSQYSGN